MASLCEEMASQKRAHSERRRVEDVRCGWKQKPSAFNVEDSEHFLQLEQRLHRQPCSRCAFFLPLNTRSSPFKLFHLCVNSQL